MTVCYLNMVFPQSKIKMMDTVVFRCIFHNQKRNETADFSAAKTRNATFKDFILKLNLLTVPSSTACIFLILLFVVVDVITSPRHLPSLNRTTP